MADNPITPPPELVQQWLGLPQAKAIQAAFQAGADRELEACCELLVQQGFDVVDDLRAARRPKPPSLNSIALEMLETIEREGHYIHEITDTIRRALEAIDD
jgi:hypothetical protein